MPRPKRGREFERWLKREEEEEKMPPPDPEELRDPLAFRATSFKQRWNEQYANSIFGSFDDESESLVNHLVLYLTYYYITISYFYVLTIYNMLWVRTVLNND